jgi:hypothetical protein
MSSATYIIGTQLDLERFIKDLRRVPLGFRVTCKRNKRTLPQNDRMWAMLTDVAQQHQYHGLWLTPEDWKLIFLAALDQELRVVPNLNNNGFVQLGRSSSKLSVEEMTALMDLIEAYSAQNDITLHDGKEAA